MPDALLVLAELLKRILFLRLSLCSANTEVNNDLSHSLRINAL